MFLRIPLLWRQPASSNTIVNQDYFTILDPSLLTGAITANGTINAQRVQLRAEKITHNGSLATPHSGFVSIRATNNITIEGTITAPQGTIDIFATNGSATINSSGSAVVSTVVDDYDFALAPGFIEFSGRHIAIEGNPFLLNSADTLLLDPDYIVIVGGTGTFF